MRNSARTSPFTGHVLGAVFTQWALHRLCIQGVPAALEPQQTAKEQGGIIVRLVAETNSVRHSIDVTAEFLAKAGGPFTILIPKPEYFARADLVDSSGHPFQKHAWERYGNSLTIRLIMNNPRASAIRELTK